MRKTTSLIARSAAVFFNVLMMSTIIIATNSTADDIFANNMDTSMSTEVETTAAKIPEEACVETTTKTCLATEHYSTNPVSYATITKLGTNMTTATETTTETVESVTEETAESVSTADIPTADDEIVETDIAEEEPVETEPEPIIDPYTGVELKYSESYYVCDNPLTSSMGVKEFNGHRETYYSEHVLPGGGLNIPERHVADDGTIRDGDGYICVASDFSYLDRYSILLTSLGPAKVYDTGCAYGTIDIYVSW